MANLRLTDITSASAVTSDSLIHIVNTGDTSQFSGGSSYKTSLATVYDAMSGYTAQTINVNNLNIFNVGSTPSISNLGIDVSGNVVYGEDVYVTGGTYSAGTITFTNNSGGTFDVNGLFTGNTDDNTFVTAFTYSSNTLTIFDNSGNTFPVTINEFTGLTATTISATTYQNLPSSVNIYNSDGTLTSNRVVTLAGNTLTFDDDILVNTITVGEGGIGGGANTILGYDIFNSLNSGQRNVAIGYQSSKDLTDGIENVSVGYLSLSTNTVGNSNVGIGSKALQLNTANSNTSVGFESMLQNTTGTENTALGSKSLSLNQTGDYNVSVGVESLYNNIAGSKNVSIGYTSSYSASSAAQNVSVGGLSLFNNVSGSSNVAIGYQSLLSATTNNNTAVGVSSLSTNTSGSGNTAVGYGANVGSGNLTNATAIGANSIVNTSDSLVLGNNANVGIGTSSPTEKLDVSGKTKTINFQMTSGATNGYVLTSDALGNASWSPSTGGGTFTGGTVTGATIFTGGVSANTISATTYQSTISNTQVVYSNNGTLTGSTAMTWTNSATTLSITGTLEATSKSFVIPHPTKEGKKLVYGSLEGPENGVYHRGKLTNENIIVLPEYWSKLVDENTVTVNLTPIGRFQNLYVKEIQLDKIIIEIESGLFGNKTIECYYTVYGERKDTDKLIIER